MSSPSSVLVVDDEPSGFTVIKALLKSEGYELFYAPNGQEALNQVETINPDVILLDVMMPEIDGIEVCRRLKTNPDWFHVPIIMITALNSKEDLARCLGTGADDFITKPVSGLELRARVRSMLRIKHQHDALKATMQLREDMSTMMVHDLRNPVTTILMASQMILMQNLLDGKAQERLRMVHMAGQQLSSMINELLIMAKLEANKLVLNQTEVDLNALAMVVVSGLQDLAQTKHLTLELELPESGQWIKADVNLLNRLMDNLLSNAIKFSPPNGRIRLRVESIPDPTLEDSQQTRTKIQVMDEGPGIQADLRQQIFNRFEVGKAIQGTSQIGLGLAFCKLVAEAHGGHIYVEENLPHGAIFTVEI